MDRIALRFTARRMEIEAWLVQLLQADRRVDRVEPVRAFDFLEKLVLPERIELSTSPLPRECSTN